MIKELIFDTNKLTKVYHIACGGHIGYIADKTRPKEESKNFYFLDGTQPHNYSPARVYCKTCDKYADLSDMGLLDKVAVDK